MTWARVLLVLWAYQQAGCLEGRAGLPRLTADSKYLANRQEDVEQQEGAGHGAETTRPVVADAACRVVFGQLRRACEEACKEVLGEEYRAFDMRLFYNCTQSDSGERLAHRPQTDGQSHVEGSVRIICMVPPGYKGRSGLKIFAKKGGPTMRGGEVGPPFLAKIFRPLLPL